LKKLLPAIVAGLVIGIVEIIPFIKSLTCCILVPFAVYYAMNLEVKGNKKATPFTLAEGIRLGILTGIFGAFFAVFLDSFLTFILRSNDFVAAFPQMEAFIQSFGVPEQTKKEVLAMLQSIVEEIKTTGISIVYSFSMLISNLIFNTILGLLGGLIGVKFINKKYFS
jgi:hypothetical protein